MTTKAVFFDALGTLVELEPPWEPLAAALGVEPGPRVVAAMRAEMAYYREHAHEARDRGVARAVCARECAALLSRELGARGRRRDDDERDPLPRLPRCRPGAHRAARARARP